MARARGNPSSQAEIELRREQVIEKLKAADHQTLTQLAEDLGVSRATLWRDLQALTVRLAETNLEEHEARVAAQEAVLELMEQALVLEKIEPEVANAWRQIRSDIASLRGLNAPSKGIVAHVSQSGDLNYLKFKKAVVGLTDVQLEDVFAYAAKLPREPRVTVRDASWFPEAEPKLLTGGEDEQPA